MNTIYLDGTKMYTIQSAHNELMRKMDLPLYYGKNLDALWDVLSTIHENTEIFLAYPSAMLNALDTYGARLLIVFFDASADNPFLTFELTDTMPDLPERRTSDDEDSSLWD
ncbi:MAG: barstar family protein [Clostridia bacterium]|nr:barstar family protein [Clostridia bacterium]